MDLKKIDLRPRWVVSLPYSPFELDSMVVPQALYRSIQGQGLAGPRKRSVEVDVPFFWCSARLWTRGASPPFLRLLPRLCAARDSRGPLLLCEGLGGMDGEGE